MINIFIFTALVILQFKKKIKGILCILETSRVKNFASRYTAEKANTLLVVKIKTKD